MARISQREARRLRKRVQELEDKLNAQQRAWVSEWPSGTSLGWRQHEAKTSDWLYNRVLTARKLKHAVVVTTEDDGKLNFFAVKL